LTVSGSRCRPSLWRRCRRSCTRRVHAGPMPVTTPLPGSSRRRVRDRLAGPSSRNGEPGSSRRSMRSRTNILVAGLVLLRARTTRPPQCVRSARGVRGQPAVHLGIGREVGARAIEYAHWMTLIAMPSRQPRPIAARMRSACRRCGLSSMPPSKARARPGCLANAATTRCAQAISSAVGVKAAWIGATCAG